MPHRPTVRLLALVATVALAAAGCGSGGDVPEAEGRPARVGETFVAQLPDGIEGTGSSFTLPGRRYEVVVTGPRDRIDSITATEEGIATDAADGTRFVAVGWDLSPAGGDALVLGGDDPTVSPQLSLVVDGEPVAVGAMDEEGVHARWVVVPSDAGRIGVSVEYDGLVQTDEDAYGDGARTEGGPALLATVDDADLHEPDCPPPTEGPEPGRYAAGGCFLTVTDPIPYHEALGWAEDGRGWVVAHLRVDPVLVGWDDPGQGGAVVDYEVEPTEIEVTLDGVAPVEVVPWEAGDPVGLLDDGTWEGNAVFSVPDDVTEVEVAFARPYLGLPEDPDEARAEGTPDELTGTYGATFTVEVG